MVFIKGKVGGGAVQPSKQQYYRDGYLLPVLAASELFAERRYHGVFALVRDLVDIPADDFEFFYQAAINQYAEFVQVLPSQQNGVLCGLLNEGLARATIALRTFVTEETGKPDPLYHYAVFTAGLCKDLSKVVVNQRIAIVDEEGKLLDNWLPFRETLRECNAEQYKIYSIAPIYQRLETSITPLLARQLLPEEGFLWIASDPEVFADWLNALNGNDSQGGRITQTLAKTRREDIYSLIAKIDFYPVEQTEGVATQHGEDFLTWLKEQIESGELKVNSADAMVHVVDDGVFIERKLFIQYADMVNIPVNANVVFTQFGNLFGIAAKGGADFLVAKYFSNYPEAAGSRTTGFASPLSQPQGTTREGLAVRGTADIFAASKVPAASQYLRSMQSQVPDSHQLPSSQQQRNPQPKTK